MNDFPYRVAAIVLLIGVVGILGLVYRGSTSATMPEIQLQKNDVLPTGAE